MNPGMALADDYDSQGSGATFDVLGGAQRLRAFAVSVFNTTAVDGFLHLFDQATAVVAQSVPVMTVPFYATATGGFVYPNGAPFKNGLRMTLSTSATDALVPGTLNGVWHVTLAKTRA